MGRFVPNEKTWVGFSATPPVSLSAPEESEVAAATPLTAFLISLNASSQGNTVPTPDLDTKFEKSIGGTVQASFTADFYRDDETDTAWETLARGTKGVMYVSRFGGTGENGIPETGDSVEVWPIEVTARTAGALTSNTAQTFTLTAACNEEPAENAAVVADTP